MAVKWPGYGKRKSGSGASPQGYPGGCAAHQQRQHREVLFHAPADCPPEPAKVMFSEWQADIDNGVTGQAARQGAPRVGESVPRSPPHNPEAPSSLSARSAILNVGFRLSGRHWLSVFASLRSRL